MVVDVSVCVPRHQQRGCKWEATRCTRWDISCSWCINKDEKQLHTYVKVFDASKVQHLGFIEKIQFISIYELESVQTFAERAYAHVACSYFHEKSLSVYNNYVYTIGLYQSRVIIFIQTVFTSLEQWCLHKRSLPVWSNYVYTKGLYQSIAIMFTLKVFASLEQLSLHKRSIPV